MKISPTSNDGRQRSLYDFNPNYSVPKEQPELTPPIIQSTKPTAIDSPKTEKSSLSSIVIEVDRDEYPSEDNPMGLKGEFLNKNSRMLG